MIAIFYHSFLCLGVVGALQAPLVSLKTKKVVLYSEEGGVKYDVGSGWKPTEGGMQSTDTPDFFYDDDGNSPSIEYTDGIMGSTGLDKLKGPRNSDPGVAGALDVDPTTIGGYQAASASDAGIKFELDTMASMGRFTEEISIDMAAASDTPRVHTIMVKPVCMSYEDFYAGFTADTPNNFSVSPTQGRMERRGGAPTALDIEIKPDGQPGTKTAFLVVTLPEENEQFTYKITVNAF
uniref:Uncharacterized protein n=1 Tax=Aureoumbra lagunensis TaxID=44058 RepID=A0A7S3JNA1_9STRA